MAKQSLREKLMNEDDKEFIAQAYSDYEASKELKPIDDWQKYDDYLEDMQWDTAEAKDEWKPKPQVNICWKVLRTIHANMVSGKTSINVTCRRPLYDDITQEIGDVMEYYWNALDMDRKISEAEWVRPKLGTTIIKAPWNPRLNDGDGDLDCSIVHPANCFPDPNITNPWDIQKADFVDFPVPKTVRYVLNNYSKEADPLCRYTRDELMEMLQPESSFSDTEIYGDAVTTSSGRVPASIVGTDKTYRSINTRARLMLHEYWYRDDNYKLQVAYVAGQVLLKNSSDDEEMKENGFYKHGRYPIVIIPYIQKDKRLWGRSEFQSLVGQDKRDGIQDIVNKIIQEYLINLKTTAQPQKAYRHGAIKDPEKWTGEGNMKIPTKGNPHSEILVLQGQIIPGVLQAVDSFLTHADRITNLWDVTQGRSTPYTKTAGGTMALLEQAMRPQNDVVRTLNDGLKELAEIWLEHLAEFVTTNREYVIDKGNDGQKVFEFNPSTILSAPKRLKDASEQGYKEEPGETRRLFFNIKIDVGATLAITKAYLVELAMNLYERKALDLPGLYKLLPEFPGKQETLERMTQGAPQGTPQGTIPPEQQIPQPVMPPGAMPPEMAGQMPAEQMPQQDEFQQFLAALPPEVVQVLMQMPEQEMIQAILAMMQMPPDQLQAYIEQLMAGGEQVGLY